MTKRRGVKAPPNLYEEGMNLSKIYHGAGGMELPNERYPAKLTDGYYRVTKDGAEQGSYKLLASAVKMCDENPGSRLIAEDSVCIYPDVAADPVTDTALENKNTGSKSAETAKEDTETTESTPRGKAEIVGYAKLKTLMNVRAEPSPDAEILGKFKEGTVFSVTEFCENGWLKLQCGNGAVGYLLNDGGRFASVGKTLYTVRQGDNLWKIAQEQLGDGGRFKEVAQLNLISDNRIRIGMELILPERDAEEGRK